MFTSFTLLKHKYKIKQYYVMVVFFDLRFAMLSFSLLMLLCAFLGPNGANAQGSTQNFSGIFGNGNNSLLNDVFNKVKDSVVQITTEYGPSDFPDRFFDTNNNSPIPTKFGSGFVYDKSGYIITNYHVVSESNDITVTFNDGNTYSAQLVGTDPYGDVAVIKLINPSEENLIPVVFSNSTKLRIGDPVLAIGNPYGLDNTLTFGIVSQMGRLLPNSDSGYSIPNVIQTDAAINPGNSGGPLIDLNGDVVGMNTAIFSNTGAYTGVGFAIPSNDVMRVIPSLIENGSYEHPWLGIAGLKLTPDLAESFGLPRDYKGVVIENVVENGPADKAGLKDMIVQGDRYGQQQIISKDILIKVDNISITRIDDVISYLDANKKVGDKINLTVNRNGQVLDLAATLTSRPALSLQEITSSPSPSDPNVNPYSPFPDFKLPQLPDLGLPQLP